MYHNSDTRINHGSSCRPLPIDQYKKSILFSLEQHGVLIIVGETGSGKSTRVPMILHSAGVYNKKVDGQHYKHRLIGITQPRRIAAIQLAQRVSNELNCELGMDVGYSVRFADVTSQDYTMIKFLTEGLLVREMIQDPLLEKYSTIMIDEVHERNLNTDIMLGLLKCIVSRRKDLKLILSSATPNIVDLVKFFTIKNDFDLHDAPGVLVIRGKTFPLKIYHTKTPVPNYLEASIETVKDIHESNRLASGKILIFLTGQDEVEYVCQRIQDYAQATSNRLDLKKLVAIPVHGSLRSEEADNVFKNCGTNERICIVSTNISETSITIDDIAFVIDCGFVKLKYYDHRTGSDLLIKVPISKSSAKQRAGRAGRTRDGRVYRLYTESNYDRLRIDTTPEIQRCCLAEVIMLLKSLGVDDILKFPLLTPMPTANLIPGVEILHALGAIDNSGKLTAIGEVMSHINIDPRLAKLLASPISSSCTVELCRLIGILQIKEIYLNGPMNQNSSWSRNNLQKICVTEGDLPSYINIMNIFIENKKSKKWAERHNLKYQALLNAAEISTRLESRLKQLGIKTAPSNGRINTIQRSLLTGLFMNTAYLHLNGEYRTLKSDQLIDIHPTSIYNEILERPKYVVFVEVLTTSKTYMRHIMSIEPDWLLDIAPHYYTFATELEMRNSRHQID